MNKLFKHSFADLTHFERWLWLASVAVITICTLLSPDGDILSLITSLIGVTALIFIAKGHVLGQALIVVFALLYGIISFSFRYYGEMITYVCMSAPMAIVSMVQWLKNPYGEGKEVKVARLNAKKLTLLVIGTVAVTIIFYFVLGALNTANLIVSTLSVTTSFFAATLTAMRSPYYAIGYAVNDVVLIALWVMACFSDISYLAMVICFVVFLVNDIYGYVSWRRMEKRQQHH